MKKGGGSFENDTVNMEFSWGIPGEKDEISILRIEFTGNV